MGPVRVIETRQLNNLLFSERARAGMQQGRCERLFVADWDKVLMVHFAVDAQRFRRDVPFELDMREGLAFVTLVAFTMRRLRPAFGGRLTSWLCGPMATHDFLNVRTYVRVGSEVGIHFLAEWVSNRLAVALGPRTFSLPYRHARINYHNDWNAGELRGRVEDARTRTAFAYRVNLQAGAPFATCDPGSLEEWLMERYNAFNSTCGRRRFFRVWHEPWAQCKAHVETADTSLLETSGHWFLGAEPVGANYSPGVRDVCLGRPHRVPAQEESQ